MAGAASAAGLAGSLLSGITGGKGAKKAAQIQADAYQKGIDEQHSEFATTQANEAPYLAAGGQGLDGLLELLGLGSGGLTGQQSAIDALKASPEFTSQYGTGQDTILQNAAATGGLRGGNTQNSLAQFGSGLLAQVIQSRLGNLGGLASMGSNTAGTLGQLGQANANAVSGLFGAQGGALAGGVMGQTKALQGIFNSLGSFGSQAGKSGIGW